ncbi:LacI family DNA-binding transcriptional regulator [Streptomyces sp. SYSU K217416]
MGRTTVKDVARHAGVSPQTVSNVLNQRGHFGEAVRQRVLASVEALGYQPSSAARSLRSNRTRQLAYHVLPGQLQARNPLVVDFLGALITSAQAQGYHITVFTTDRDALDGFRDLIAARTADAFLLSDCDRFDRRARYLAERRIPFAALGRTADDLPQSWVDIDNIAAAAAMVDHLAASGHRSIAYLARDDDRYWTRDRFTGYLRGLERNRLSAHKDLIARRASPSVYDTVQAMLRHTPRPTAIMTDSDVLAAAAVNALKAAGPRQGADVAVAGFDGGLMEHLSEPPAASVRMPTAAIAERLIARCLDEIEGTAGARPGELVPTTITSIATPQ